MVGLTLNIPKELVEALVRRHATLEETVLAISRERFTQTRRFSNGLRQFADVREFERNTAPFREIEPKMRRSGHG